MKIGYARVSTKESGSHFADRCLKESRLPTDFSGEDDRINQGASGVAEDD